MKLRKLTLSNFRGFKQLEIDFSPVKATESDSQSKEIVVIAGVNGVGKSTILQAISKTASYLLPEVTTAKKEPDSFKKSDVHAGKLNMSVSAVFEVNDGLEIWTNIARNQLDPKRINEIREERERIRSQQRYVEKNSPEDIEYNDRLRQLDELLQTDEDYFSWQADKERLKIGNPLIVYYSTNRSLSRLPPRLPQVKPLTTTSAYVNALKGTEVSLNDFANWYRAVQEGLLGSKKFGQELLPMLEDVIQKMMPDSEFHDLKLVQSSRPYFTIRKRDSLLELDQLSDGERGLLALAFDMTRRLAITNPRSPNPVKNGSAIVLIDEVELHLHPTWQRQVLRRLTSTFQNCQFIITTHSPLVLGETKPYEIRFLQYEREMETVIVTVPSESFGLDVNRVLAELMGASVRNKNITEKLDQLFRIIDDEDFDRARQSMIPLIEYIGENDPEIVRAQSLIDFLEGNE